MTVEPIEGTEPNAESPSDETATQARASGDAQPTSSDEPEAEVAVETSAASEPSTEAAVGASGARPLGAADATSQAADAAVEAMDRPPEGEAAPPPADASPSSEATAEDLSQDRGSADSPAEASDSEAPTAQTEAPTAQEAPPAETEAPSAETAAGAPLTGEAEPGAEAAAADPASAGADDADAGTAGGPETAVDATDSAEGSDFADAPPAEEPDDAPAPFIDDRPEPTTMEELLNEQTDEIRSLKHGDVVEGQVVRIDKDEILVDIGAKSEGVVSNRELYGRNAESQPELNIGDTVLVYVLQPESNEGHAVLSLRRAGLERKWRSMQEQLDEGVIIEAPVIDHNKGGLIVDCGIRGFVPISQIVDFPRRPQNEQPRDAAQEIAEKLQPYVGRKLRLKILEVNRKANRLILSEKVALYEERREKRDELFSSLTVGQKVTGSVRSIAPFGVFVDLGGIDGLVHKSELSWNKVNNPESGYKVGEEVEAEVIDINHERGRISLSIRRLQPDPWHSTVADLKVGDVIDGTVTKIVNFGSFVRVRDGLEGLIHISELSHQRVAHPGDVVHEGQNLKLKVISLDSERHRLGLSLKQAEEAPARPAPSEPRERRPRSSGPTYDPSQAVQEPEEGIDNTLAAAFAQVRLQMAESEGSDEPAGSGEASPAASADAHGTDASDPETDASTEATPVPAEESPAEESPAEEPDAATAAGVLSQAPEPDDAPATQSSEASALEVGPAEDRSPEEAPAAVETVGDDSAAQAGDDAASTDSDAAAADEAVSTDSDAAAADDAVSSDSDAAAADDAVSTDSDAAAADDAVS
ncbi:MAG: 30S ribosomal protein S1, partial [Chloroflexota bacterium]|nr:30S ribosomal protein S1 [Chloroflexota bacterium]